MIPPIFDWGFTVDLTSGFVPTLAVCAFFVAYCGATFVVTGFTAVTGFETGLGSVGLSTLAAGYAVLATGFAVVLTGGVGLATALVSSF